MLWLALIACVPDLPPSHVDVQERPWAVHGSTPSEIRRSLLADAPRPGAAGSTHVGADVTCQAGMGGVGVADVSVQVRIEVAVPRWEAPSGATSSLRRRWDRFDRAVHHHELAHAAIASDHLSALDARLRRAPSCAAAFEDVREVVDELGRSQAAWDRKNGALRF